jgi:hypothetical protein
MKRVLPVLVLCCLAFAAHARTLAEIKARGAIGLCAHPNSMPFASKTAEPPGFQIELGRALARELGVSMMPDWILTAGQISRADCDIMLDVIADPEAQEESRLKLSKPYLPLRGIAGGAAEQPDQLLRDPGQHDQGGRAGWIDHRHDLGQAARPHFHFRF